MYVWMYLHLITEQTIEQTQQFVDSTKKTHTQKTETKS